MTYRERLLIVALEDGIAAQRSLQRALYEFADQSPRDEVKEEGGQEKMKDPDTLKTGQWSPVIFPSAVPDVPAGTQVWPTPAPVFIPNPNTTGPYTPPNGTIIMGKTETLAYNGTQEGGTVTIPAEDIPF